MLEFVTTDVDALRAERIAAAEAVLGRSLAPADPVTLLIDVFLLPELQLRNLLNFSANMNLLDYSTGAYLDALGAFIGVTRLPASAALVTLRFTLSAVQPGVITIPAGTRATGSGGVIFTTQENADIAAGDMTVDVTAEATITGDAGNGYLAGQINELVDPLPWLQSVASTTTSQGGTDAETDAALRERIRQAPTTFSTAGPTDAYAYWAKTASPSIIDVSVTSPDAGEVLITPLLEDGEIPGTEILDAVEAACSDVTRRPLTDLVTAAAPTPVDYDITVTYYIDRTLADEEVSLQAAIEAAVASYATWQRSKLGRNINPSELISRMMQAGALRVEITDPAYATVDLTEVAADGDIDITYGGLEDA